MHQIKKYAYWLIFPFILISQFCLLLFIKVIAVSLAAVNWQNNPALGDIFDYARQSYHLRNVARIKNRYKKIHKSVYWGEETLIYGDGKIEIGEGSYIGQRSFILAHPEDTKLTIGKNCSISHNVHIRTESHRRVYDYKNELELPAYGKDVVISDSVWIGANVFIKGGITIGDNVIIGANSVVTHDIPSNTIYGGVPAKLIRHKDEYKKLKDN